MRACRAIGGSRGAALIALSMWVLLVAGCTFESPLSPTVDTPRDIAPVALAVGVYYSPDFQAMVHVVQPDSVRFNVPVGAGSVILFDQLFPRMFATAQPVSTLPPFHPGAPEVAAVIEPVVESVDIRLPLFWGDYTVEITYRITLYSPKGVPFASWPVTGFGRKGMSFFAQATHATPIGITTELAMEDAANKLFTGFRDVPEVRRWLRDAGIAVGN